MEGQNKWIDSFAAEQLPAQKERKIGDLHFFI